MSKMHKFGCFCAVLGTKKLHPTDAGCSPSIKPFLSRLLHRHALCKVAGLVDVAAPHHCDVVGEQL